MHSCTEPSDATLKAAPRQNKGSPFEVGFWLSGTVHWKYCLTPVGSKTWSSTGAPAGAVFVNTTTNERVPHQQQVDRPPPYHASDSTTQSTCYVKTNEVRTSYGVGMQSKTKNHKDNKFHNYIVYIETKRNSKQRHVIHDVAVIGHTLMLTCTPLSVVTTRYSTF